MFKRLFPILLLLGLIVAAPLVLRRDTDVAESDQGDDRLVIITPHNDSIRTEFGEAFAAWWKGQTGRTVFIDWRAPGGGGDIKRVLDASFGAAKALGKEGTEFDVFFGGGDKDFIEQAAKDRLVPLEVFEKHPEWFGDDKLPAVFSGQEYYDKDKRWVGVCVSQFGIVYNRDAIGWLKVNPPRKWRDLCHPAYFGRVALADPTMSSSVNQAFEMMIQEQMQAVIRLKGDTPAAREEGWRNGMLVILGMGANARYFTDSSSKVPYDVALGDAAAGTCIDFYGRTTEDAVRHGRGESRVHWISPPGGTSVSVDPIAVFRGAPNGKVAQAFVTFCLSDQGQSLWNLKPGTPEGPRGRALRRLPVRKDLYTPERLANFTDPDALPFERAGEFVYQPDLTAPAFNALRIIIRAMCIDPQDELKAAWKWAVVDRGGPADVVFDLSEVGYSKVMNEWVPLTQKKDVLETARKTTELSRSFRDQYRRIAEGKGARP